MTFTYQDMGQAFQVFFPLYFSFFVARFFKKKNLKIFHDHQNIYSVLFLLDELLSYFPLC